MKAFIVMMNIIINLKNSKPEASTKFNRMNDLVKKLIDDGVFNKLNEEVLLFSGLN